MRGRGGDQRFHPHTAAVFALIMLGRVGKRVFARWSDDAEYAGVLEGRLGRVMWGFNGIIDDVRFFANALTSSQVAALAQP